MTNGDWYVTVMAVAVIRELMAIAAGGDCRQAEQPPSREKPLTLAEVRAAAPRPAQPWVFGCEAACGEASRRRMSHRRRHRWPPSRPNSIRSACNRSQRN
jgi:hypothetical protein